MIFVKVFFLKHTWEALLTSVTCHGIQQIIVLTISPLLSTVGYYRLIMMSFVIKVSPFE